MLAVSKRDEQIHLRHPCLPLPPLITTHTGVSCMICLFKERCAFPQRDGKGQVPLHSGSICCTLFWWLWGLSRVARRAEVRDEERGFSMSYTAGWARPPSLSFHSLPLTYDQASCCLRS